MKRILVTSLLFVFALSAYGHRLNEYLQATTISLAKDRVTLHLHLIAGSDIAEKVLKEIDANGDGILSDAELQAYARLIVHNLSLTIDKRDEPLSLVNWNFPTVTEITNGLGDIQLIITTKIAPGGSTHHLVFEHHDQQASVVYLVNCLLSADTTIRIVNQTRNADQSVYTLDFSKGETHPVMSANQQSLDKTDHWAVIKTYFVHGVKHILTGYDHLLFLCALVLGAAGLWDLIKIVTAFTIAHSITLTLATYGLAHLPEQVVEPMIAASIVFVAVQNIFWPKQAGGYSRLAIAFFFGLFHGLGFAGGLLELMHAMPANLTVFAILGFSLGVEAGNQLVLLPLYGILKITQRTKTQHHKVLLITRVQRFGSAAVAVAGVYYLYVAIV